MACRCRCRRPIIKRIVVIGDTGCRLKGTFVQDCNDPVKWPFATVARLAAARHPDLVIHVGDYHYRETPCPADRAGCAGSPYGDNWAVWQKRLLRSGRASAGGGALGSWCAATTRFVAAAGMAGSVCSIRIRARLMRGDHASVRAAHRYAEPADVRRCRCR